MYLAILAATTFVVLLIGLWLFLHRDPDFDTRKVPGYLSPADGVVCDIYKVEKKEQFIKKHSSGITAMLHDAPWAKQIVVIMMQPQHIHTQRSPVDGVITQVMHKPGLKMNAVFGDYRKATAENEHVAITITGKHQCKVYLIAGLLARRIKPTVKVKQKIVQGERIGSIAFGSQVAIVLPKATVRVKVGERVLVGRTEIAR